MADCNSGKGRPANLATSQLNISEGLVEAAEAEDASPDIADNPSSSARCAAYAAQRGPLWLRELIRRISDTHSQVPFPLPSPSLSQGVHGFMKRFSSEPILRLQENDGGMFDPPPLTCTTAALPLSQQQARSPGVPLEGLYCAVATLQLLFLGPIRDGTLDVTSGQCRLLLVRRMWCGK